MSQPPPIRVGCRGIRLDIACDVTHSDHAQDPTRKEGWENRNSYWIDIPNLPPRATKLTLVAYFDHKLGPRVIGTAMLSSWEVDKLVDIRDTGQE